MPNQPEKGSSGKQYEPIYKSDIWEFIINSDYYFTEVELDYTNEFVFDITYTGKYSPIDEDVAIRWFTSVDKDTEVSRPSGQDAMRLMVVHLRTGRPLFQEVRTHRIKTWRRNVKKKIDSLKSKLHNTPDCPRCGAPLVIVQANTGKKFRGCSNYFPNKECTYTQDV